MREWKTVRGADGDEADYRKERGCAVWLKQSRGSRRRSGRCDQLETTEVNEASSVGGQIPGMASMLVCPVMSDLGIGSRAASHPSPRERAQRETRGDEGRHGGTTQAPLHSR